MGKTLDVEFGAITSDNVEQLRKVNVACFPVQYQEAYYKDVVARRDEGLCKFAYWNGFVVGAACARVEMIDAEDASAGQRIYIMTLGVLAAYRGRGIGTQLVQSIMEHYEQNLAGSTSPTIVEFALHVEVSNTDAMEFYTKRFGFTKGELVENYYHPRFVDPPHCYRLYKKVGPEEGKATN